MANVSKMVWSIVCTGVVYVPALAVGGVRGTYNVLTGKGSFDEGGDTSAKILDAAIDFGENNADELNRFVRDVAVSVFAGKVGKVIGGKS